MIKPQTLKGFRDFLPEEALKRQYAIDIIRKTFELYGFDPLETPALEYAETLLGKYGNEADKLLYLFEDRGKRRVGLRYDQTVPLARVISQYPELTKPFKRYQIQPVWRAENTQRGRYREFLQCDADIIGDNFHPTADAEILSLIWSIYSELGFKNFKLVVNSRTLLETKVNQAFGNPTSQKIKNHIFLHITRILDKINKIGRDQVEAELLKEGFPANNIIRLLQSTDNKSYREIQNEDRDLFYSLQMAIENFGIPEKSIKIDPFMSRGLDYYTGLIVEGVDNNYQGSLVGGGRYDQLINQFTGKDNSIPAVGFAIGFDRTLDALETLNILFTKQTNAKVLICIVENWKDVFPKALNTTAKLRNNRINTEMYLNPQERLEKQLKYADKKKIPFALIIDEEGIKSDKYILRNMSERTQNTLTLDQAINALKKN